jgi:multicomponent Na+:H+ antiporter subunit E
MSGSIYSWRAWLARAAGFLLFWLILSGFKLADLPIGMLAATLATWASLRLLPPVERTVHPIVLIQFAVHFLYRSILAGIDVAGRALDPRLPLQPGLVIYRTRIPPGPMRDSFCTITSLLPGTLPSGCVENNGLMIHCLDVTQQVEEQLTAEEMMLMRVFWRTEYYG